MLDEHRRPEYAGLHQIQERRRRQRRAPPRAARRPARAIGGIPSASRFGGLDPGGAGSTTAATKRRASASTARRPPSGVTLPHHPQRRQGLPERSQSRSGHFRRAPQDGGAEVIIAASAALG